MDLNNIIYKFLKGKHSNEELDVLEAWKSEAEDNIQALKDMARIEEMAGELKDQKVFNASSVWDRIEPSLESDKENNVLVVPAYRKWMMAAAAMVVLLLSSVFVFDLNNSLGPDNFVAIDNNLEVTLPDGSFVALDNQSRLDRNSDFNELRDVALEGRAFFEIEKDTRPFEVALKKGTIRVLGTKFSVLSSEDYQEIFVTEGKVRYTLDDREFDLVAGDFIKVVGNDIIKLDQTNRNYLSWKEQKLVFVNDNLSQIISDLNKHYRSNIKINKDIRQTNCKLSTVFQGESLEEVLDELSQVIGVKYEKTSTNEIIITDVDC